MSRQLQRAVAVGRGSIGRSAKGGRGESRKAGRALAGPAEAPASRIAFFHQNNVCGAQGGIERYISTILEASSGEAVFVGPAAPGAEFTHFDVAVADPGRGPKWVNFLIAVLAQRRKIRAFLKAEGVGVLEFSRPEYLLAGLLFPGKRVVTIHGTGPGPGHGTHRLLHLMACWLAVAIADRVQIVGYDVSGVPALARRLLGNRISHVQAWHADAFVPSPLPLSPGAATLRVFYAGRIAPQKDPALLFATLRAAIARSEGNYEFHYFGSDFEAFAQAGLADAVINHGLLGPTALADEIAKCHVGLLCSAFGEGSPYIVVEALACGRPFVMPALPTLRRAYQRFSGVRLVETRQASAYLEALEAIRAEIRAGAIDPFAIADQLKSRSQSRAVPKLLESLISLTSGGASDRI